MFKYVIYDSEREYEIKRDLFKNISNLILAYGKTMDNKDHGSNLLHKLLLEGRLKTEKIELENMNFSFDGPSIYVNNKEC